MQVKDITSNSLVYCSLLANYAGGTETDPFLIASAEDFNKYAKAEYFGNAEYYFKQIANITSSALTQTTLAGHYDGGNYTITSSNSNKAIS